MRIIQRPNVWWRFSVPLKQEREESREHYLKRAKQCVLAFHKANRDRRKPYFLGVRHSNFSNIYGNFPPEQLTEEGLDYKYFDIARFFHRPTADGNGYYARFEGSVTLYVEPNSECSVEKVAGIVSMVGTIQDDRTKERRENLEFIKGLWRQFKYIPRT